MPVIDPVEGGPYTIKGGETSRGAAASAVESGSAADRRERIYSMIAEAGEDGLTADEIEVTTGYGMNTVTARMWELRGGNEFNWFPRRIWWSGAVRRTRADKSAGVCVLLELSNEPDADNWPEEPLMTTRTRSVSKKREERRENDAYETPPALCTAVVSRLIEKGCRPHRVLEPGCGRGNFIRACRAGWPVASIVGVEIREKYTEHKHVDACVDMVQGDAQIVCKMEYKTMVTEIEVAGANAIGIGDFLKTEGLVHGPFDLIIGNPPYGGGLGEAFVKKSVELLGPSGVLAFVLKMHFFGTKKRIELWKECPFFVAWPIIPRPDFTGDGRDTAEYALIVWAKDTEGKLRAIAPTLEVREPLIWSPR